MFYSATPPSLWGDRIHLHSSIAAARAVIGDGRPVLGVALRFDGRGRCVVPLRTDAHAFDPTWTSPAEVLADGSILARGPIPESLPIHLEPAALPHASPTTSIDEEASRCAPH